MHEETKVNGWGRAVGTWVSDLPVCISVTSAMFLARHDSARPFGEQFPHCLLATEAQGPTLASPVMTFPSIDPFANSEYGSKGHCGCSIWASTRRDVDCEQGGNQNLPLRR